MARSTKACLAAVKNLQFVYGSSGSLTRGFLIESQHRQIIILASFQRNNHSGTLTVYSTGFSKAFLVYSLQLVSSLGWRIVKPSCQILELWGILKPCIHILPASFGTWLANGERVWHKIETDGQDLTWRKLGRRKERKKTKGDRNKGKEKGKGKGKREGERGKGRKDKGKGKAKTGNWRQEEEES